MLAWSLLYAMRVAAHWLTDCRNNLIWVGHWDGTRKFGMEALRFQRRPRGD